MIHQQWTVPFPASTSSGHPGWFWYVDKCPRPKDPGPGNKIDRNNFFNLQNLTFPPFYAIIYTKENLRACLPRSLSAITIYEEISQMAQNRLHFDFSINGTKDRRDFVDTYVQRPEFLRSPLTEDELETIANYILWGKDEDGQNCT